MTTVVALGGNALIGPGERGTAAEQLANLRATARALEPVLAGGDDIVITHGNGPQVGNELLRQERAAEEAPPLPLWLAVAQTQAEIGALEPVLAGGDDIVITHGNGPQVGNELLRQERAAEEAPPLPLWLAVAQTQAEIGALIEASFPPPVACVLTHVRVDPDDEAFSRPTKPIGPFYSEERARELERERGWAIVQDSGRGWRRVVPSPEPLEVVELDSIRTLLVRGTTVVSCGGGGIPVGAAMNGLDAVIDKDRASALLATELPAERLVILTAVPAVYQSFGTPDQKELRELSPADAERLLGELAEGSMRPKVEAAAAFVRATGGEVLITSVEALEAALDGRAGTLVRA